MTVPSELEQRLSQLIERYRELQQAKHEMAQGLEDQARTIRELEERNAGLRAQIDDLGKDRFTIKQLRDERRIIKRRLTSAMNRLEALEQQL